MRIQFFGALAGLFLLVPSAPLTAATIELSPIGNAPVVISGQGRVAQTFANVFTSTEDLFGATVTAEADDATGLLRTFASHGGDAGNVPAPASTAFAGVSGTGRITGPNAGPVQGRLIYDFHATADTLTGETGAPVGGVATGRLGLNIEVGTELRPGFALTDFSTARGSLQYASEHFFGASSPSTISFVQSLSGVRSTNVFRNATAINPVQNDSDISFSITQVSDTLIEGIIEVLFTAQVGDRMLFSADMRSSASSAAGHIASLNALNTGTLSLDLPDGFGFLPDDGIFLSQQSAIAAVPLPPSFALLLAGLAAIGLLRRRRVGRMDA